MVVFSSSGSLTPASVLSVSYLATPTDNLSLTANVTEADVESFSS